MGNDIYLETSTSLLEYQTSSEVSMPLESFITYCIYKYCAPEVKLHVITTNISENYTVCFNDDSLVFAQQIPWQVSSCVYPVTMYDDTIITGLCAVARHIAKYRTQTQSIKEHEEGLLGFRKSCLQAPNEVSIWTKFCEVDILKSVKKILDVDKLSEMPRNLVRFENHLNKPVRVHNVYKIARDFTKKNTELNNAGQCKDEKVIDKSNTVRAAKPRRWKSNAKKEQQIDSSTKIEDLNVSHQFAEGPFFTLADLVLLPSYTIIMKTIGSNVIKSLLPLTMKWYSNLYDIPELDSLKKILNKINHKTMIIENITVPVMDGVSLYKCDPTRHNPKKRLFTKEDDIENALSVIIDGMKLNVDANNYDLTFDWNDIPDGANPMAGHLPDVRMHRKSQQLENLTLAVLSIAKEGDKIVDFCSGSGHLGILIAYLLPKCTVILLENKEQSLLRARKRVHEMGLKNLFFFQCNLDFGVALHACGIASDLVLDKCLRAHAKFVLCPCCYGSLHSTDRLAYPRSNRFSIMNIEQYMCIGHAADQTHEEHPLTVRGDLCMAVIDSDRARLAEEFGYKVTLSRLKPLTCTPKNNLLVGVPS
jgi:SAM-dependent methyltransferase